MRPLALCTDPVLLSHPLIQEGHATPLHYIHFDPYHDSMVDYLRYRDWCRAHPDTLRCVSGGWLGVEGFDVDRIENGVNVGCTPEEFQKGMEGRGFKMTRDLLRLSQVSSRMRVDGLLPHIFHVDHEPRSVPVHTAPLPERALFDSRRCDHFKTMLTSAGLYATLSRIIIEFTQFSNRPDPMAWDYNGVRVPFNRVRPKFCSSTELYSTPDGGATIKLAAYLCTVDSPAFPLVWPGNWEMFRDQVAVCTRWDAVPILYFDEAFGGSVYWQATQAVAALTTPYTQ